MKRLLARTLVNLLISRHSTILEKVIGKELAPLLFRWALRVDKPRWQQVGHTLKRTR